MISCPKCHRDAGQGNVAWSPELILSSFDPMVGARLACDRSERFPLPKTVYLEVPVRPPIALNL
jgi:hypothetical protein